MRKLYLFGVPGKSGGASTKIVALLHLLRSEFDITVVLGNPKLLKDAWLAGLLKRLNIPGISRKDLPARAEGVALSICEEDFFASGTARRVKDAGLRLVFSNEMMWAFDGEAEAAKSGLIDKVLYVSDFQEKVFAEMYRGAPSAVTGNYIAPEEFEFAERHNPTFTIGRLSRPGRDKFPEDFPVFYEELGLKDVRYRVMAWSQEMAQYYRWHRFGPEWDLLGQQKEPAEKFLQSLDVFLYPLNHRFKESWGRSTVEAMLTGAVPVVPAGHQFHNLMVHGESGFICRTFAEYRDTVRELRENYPWRMKISRQCAEHARTKICNAEEHRKMWVEALTT